MILQMVRPGGDGKLRRFDPLARREIQSVDANMPLLVGF
jgi:hypothetical protein